MATTFSGIKLPTTPTKPIVAPPNPYGGVSYSGLQGSANPLAKLTIPTPIAAPNLSALPLVPPAVRASPAPVTAISASNLAPQPAPVYPVATMPTGAQNNLSAKLGGIGEGYSLATENALTSAQINQQNAAAAAKTGATAQPTQRQSILDRILGLNDDIADKSGRSYDIQQEEGVFQKKTEATRLENQYISTMRSYDKKIDDVRTNSVGKSVEAVAKDIDELTRKKNDELSGLAFDQKIAAGAYKDAFDIAEARVDAEFEPLQAQVDNLTQWYQLSADDLTESEKLQVQEKINEKQASVDFERQKQLYQYKNIIDQSDPLYKANLAKANLDVAKLSGALAGGGIVDVATIADPNAPSVNNNYAALAQVFKANDVSPANKTAIGNGLALLKAASDLANANASGEFAGFYPGRGIADAVLPEGLRREQTVANDALIAALDLQTQFWASGAALSDPQTAKVMDMIPQKGDTDKAVRTKTNQLVNYMLSQTASRLITDGIQFKPSEVNLYEMADLYKEASPEQKAQLKELGYVE